MLFPNRLGHGLGRTLRGLVAVLLLAMMALTFVDVLGRYLFNSPLNGATEATELLLVSLIFAALPGVTAGDQHVTIDLLDTVIPLGVRRFLRPVIRLISTAVLAVMAWVVWRHAGRTADAGDETDILGLELAPFAYFISVMCALAALVLLAKMFRDSSDRSSP